MVFKPFHREHTLQKACNSSYLNTTSERSITVSKSNDSICNTDLISYKLESFIVTEEDRCSNEKALDSQTTIEFLICIKQLIK